MAVTKIHPIKSTLKKALDYIENPAKTDEKMLVSSFACSYETADIEFELLLSQAMQKGNNLAHHLIQSFAPGETTPEQAHEIGRQLADEVLQGKYPYVLTTHIDKGHVHNHIIFCAVDMVNAAMESIIAKVMELQDRENTNLPLYEKQLRDAESGIQNMLNAIQAGILTSSTKERLEQLEETKRELEARIAEEKLAKPKIKEEFIRFWLMRFRKLDMSLKDQRQALVDTFINSIYLYDDKVLIAFNYKEGTQTITFEEAAQAASKENGSDLDCFTALSNDSFQKGCRFSFLYPSF